MIYTINMFLSNSVNLNMFIITDAQACDCVTCMQLIQNQALKNKFLLISLSWFHDICLPGVSGVVKRNL